MARRSATRAPARAASSGGGELEAEIAALYQGPRDAFTAARDALARELRVAGRSADAARVRGLARPTLSAWAVSHLFAREPRAVGRLLEGGAAARDALRATLARGDGAAMRSAVERVREEGASLARRAADLAREDTGKAPSATIVERIGNDLTALALSPAAADAAARGWIATDLDPPGIEVLTAAAGPARRARPAARHARTRARSRSR